ncbi:MAG TPA: MFS transporter [Bradyrhizobium sp.]|nr:MFS transporter [Bradyrhizobium sp.]
MPADVTAASRPAGKLAGVKRTNIRWYVLLLISLMYMITYMDRSNISIAAPEIAREFGFSKTEVALFFSAFAWAYAAGQVPGGGLADFFGPKRVLLAIVPFWSLMTAATAWASGATSFFWVRFAFGLGEAGAFPTASRAMQLWFPKSERGFVQGMTHCFSRLAIAITPPVAVMIMNAWGWRWVFYSFALIGIVWSAAFLLLYRNRPEDEARVNAEELAHIRGRSPDGEIGPVATHVRSDVPWRAIFTSPNMWFIAAAYGCFFYGAYFYVSWFPTYLLEFRHLSLKSMGYLASLPLISAMVGDLAGGLLTDRVLRITGNLRLARRVVAAPGLFLAAMLLIPAATTQSAIIAILCLTASNFFLELVLGPAWAVPMDVGGTSSGTVTAVMNMVGAVGASISPLVFGFLVERGSWIAPFYVTAAVLTSGALIWIFLIDPEKSVVDTGCVR